MSTLPEALYLKANAVLNAARKAEIMIATAESCTGGLIAASLTEIAGSSNVVDRGFVTYSNLSKTEMLGVPLCVIESHGAVSEDVARAMAEGALARSQAEVVVSVTGIAGPGGGTVDKPVGLVWFGLATKDGPVKTRMETFGDQGRAGIRELTVLTALDWILSELK